VYKWVSFIALLPAYLGAGIFHGNYQEAKQQASEQHCPLILFFNGSDWSGLSMKMKREILDTPEFSQGVEGNFVCVEIDYPQHTELAVEQRVKNQEILEKFQITQFPSLLVVSDEERVLVKLGYYPENGGMLAADLMRLAALDKKLCEDLQHLTVLSPEELWLAYDAAQQLQQQEALQQILAAGTHSREPGLFLVERYRQLVMQEGYPHQMALEIRRQLFQLDPNNQQGYFYTLALIDFQSYASAQPALSPEDVIRPLCDYIQQFGGQNTEHTWRIEMMIAQFYLEQDHWNYALQHAETAYQAAPEECRLDLRPMLEYLRHQTAQVAQMEDAVLHDVQ